MRGLVAGTVQFGFLIGSLLFSLIFLFLLRCFCFICLIGTCSTSSIEGTITIEWKTSRDLFSQFERVLTHGTSRKDQVCLQKLSLAIVRL